MEENGVNMKENILKQKSYDFAISIVNLCAKINNKKKNYVLTNQLLRSGTSVGALIREAEYAQSKADFVNKLSISLKEANETYYWLSILKDTANISKTDYDNLKPKIEELIKILTSSINTSKGIHGK